MKKIVVMKGGNYCFANPWTKVFLTIAIPIIFKIHKGTFTHSLLFLIFPKIFHSTRPLNFPPNDPFA